MAKKVHSKKKSNGAARAKTITLPVLGKGENYAGIILESGKPAHHLILLPGELERGNWTEAGEWAKKQGGVLPTRREQSLLFANAKEHFQSAWYWSGEQCAGYEGCAWYQCFCYGYQYYNHKDSDYRARAVRRVSIR